MAAKASHPMRGRPRKHQTDALGRPRKHRKPRAPERPHRGMPGGPAGPLCECRKCRKMRGEGGPQEPVAKGVYMIPVVLRDAMREEAERRGVSQAFLVREGVTQYLGMTGSIPRLLLARLGDEARLRNTTEGDIISMVLEAFFAGLDAEKEVHVA